MIFSEQGIFTAYEPSLSMAADPYPMTCFAAQQAGIDMHAGAVLAPLYIGDNVGALRKGQSRLAGTSNKRAGRVRYPGSSSKRLRPD